MNVINTVNEINVIGNIFVNCYENSVRWSRTWHERTLENYGIKKREISNKTEDYIARV